MTDSQIQPEWYEVTPLNSTQDLWIVAAWEGKPEYGAPTLADGREILDVIADGDLDQIPFPVWFERDTTARGKRRGDILWAGGLKFGIVSRRFADAVAELGVTGVKTYDVELFDRRNGPIEGYVGFVPSRDGTSEISSYSWTSGFHSFTWIISSRVLAGLKKRGVDMFKVEPLTKKKLTPRI